MSNILEESWVYQEILQKGIEQGIEQEKERGLLHFVELRFPSLLALAREVIGRGMSLQQLQVLQRKIYSASTIDEVRSALQGA